MKSLRQLRNQLLGVRLDATNIAQWNIVTTVNEYARVAINDAINVFPMQVEVVHTSGLVVGGTLVLPKRVNHIVRVETVGDTSTPRRELKHWNLFPTPNTVYLRIFGEADGRIDVTYRYRQPELPKNTVVITDTIDAVVVSGVAPSYTWPAPPAYIEFYRDTVGYALREVARYEDFDFHAFRALSRNVEGTSQLWPTNTIVSACCVAPDEDLRPVYLMAQAVMYEFFLRHRALYDQYTAIASMQALSLEELQVLIRDLEARARLDFESRRRLPQPTRRNLRRPIPT